MREPLERAIQSQIRAKLRADGWLVAKSHCNKFQKGWPDLYCYHPRHGPRWVEVKRPTEGRLTKDQRIRFPEWESYGVPIWILTSVEEVGLIFGPPNWRRFYV